MVCNSQRKTSENNIQAARLKVCSINICGMSDRSQLTLDKFCFDNSIDILAVQESNTTNPSNYELKNMEFISDKNNSMNKGAMLYVNAEKLSITDLPSISKLSSNIDSAWGLVSGKGMRMIIGSVYVKLNHNNGIKELMKMLEAAKKMTKQLKAKGLFCTGDFNARHKLWGDHLDNDYGKQLVDNLNFQDFSILCSDTPTFLSANGSSNIDFVITSVDSEHLFSHVYTAPDVELFSGAPTRGHVPVLTSISPPGFTDSKPLPKKKIDISSMDWHGWTNAIEENLPKEQSHFNLLSVQDKWSKIDTIIHNATKEFAKQKLSSVHSKPYWTEELTQASLKLRDASKAYSKRNTPSNKTILDSAKDYFENIRKEECKKFILNRTHRLNAAQSTRFWKEFKRMFAKRVNRKVEPLVSSANSTILTDPEEIEQELFQSFFEGAHLEKKGQDFDDSFFKTVNDIYENIMQSLSASKSNAKTNDLNGLSSSISLSEMTSFIDSYNSSGKGFDNHHFHPTMLKHLGPIARNSLLNLFNTCLQTGVWVWDLADVIFLKKEGKKDFTKSGSYRPISITSYIGKVFEKIIAARLEEFFTSIGISDKFQEGFTKRRNTIRYLNRLDGDIRDKLSKKYTVICLFIDFEKAFDSVWKKGLMKKLHDVGIRGNLWVLIDSFLFSKKVKLMFNDYTGIVRACREYGLPQGSALSPILFRFYLSDFVMEVELEYEDDISLFKFADDGTLRIIAKTTSKCLEKLQSACHLVSNWSNKWRMVVNCEPSKTELICFGTIENNDDLLPPSIMLGRNAIRFVEKTKVLGLTMDKKLKYIEHGKEINRKIVGRWAMICKYSNRNWGFKQKVIVKLVEVIIASCIQYAGIVWINNSSKKTIDHIWYKMLKSATGAVFNVKLEVAEAILGVIPIFVSNRVNSIKHILKMNIYEDCNNYHDPLKEFICHHIKCTKYSPTITKVKEVYQFLFWKSQSKPTDFTSCDLEILKKMDLQSFSKLSSSCCKYTHTQIKTYSELLWQHTINSQFQSEGFNDPPKVSSSKLKIPISTNRKLETLALSLFYPNNLLNEFLFKYDPARFDSPLCRCGSQEQNAEHLLLYCPLIKYSKRKKMQEMISSKIDLEVQSANNRVTYPLLISWSKDEHFLKLCVEIVENAMNFLKIEIVL